MTTWRVLLTRDRSIFHDVPEDATVPPVKQAYQAWSVARPILENKRAEKYPDDPREPIPFDACEFQQLGPVMKMTVVA